MDTGIDYDTCFWHDPNVAVPVNTVSMAHRKIVSYHTSPSNSRDPTSSPAPGGDTQGHGTHTAGSIAGQVLSSDSSIQRGLSEYNGMAYKAKLAVFDFHTPAMTAYELDIPGDLYNDYLLKAYVNSHARVSSNSWGDDKGNYDTYAIDVDRFVVDYPDMVIAFAAGNNGLKGYHTVSSPGVGKNVISVGSSKNGAASFVDLGYDSGIQSLHLHHMLVWYQWHQHHLVPHSGNSHYMIVCMW